MSEPTWKKYPNCKQGGEYIELFGLVLAAWPTGAWTVHDPKHRVPCKTSELAPVLYPAPEADALTMAKEQATMAAHAMRPYEPTPLPDGI